MVGSVVADLSANTTSHARLDLGWNGFGFNHNNTEVKSPNVDALARAGVVLGS